MLKPINEASKKEVEIYAGGGETGCTSNEGSCSGGDPYYTCSWCDARDACSRCDSEWCSPFSNDKD